MTTGQLIKGQSSFSLNVTVLAKALHELPYKKNAPIKDNCLLHRAPLAGFIQHIITTSNENTGQKQIFATWYHTPLLPNHATPPTFALEPLLE